MKCFYEDHTERVGQRCNGHVIFGVAGYFADGSPLMMCYAHHKWWNRVVQHSYPYKFKFLKQRFSKRSAVAKSVGGSTEANPNPKGSAGKISGS